MTDDSQIIDLISMQQHYLRLHRQRGEMAERLKALDQDLEELEQRLAEQMAAIGQKSTQIEGMRLTVRVTPRIGKRGEISMEEFCDAVRGTEYGWMVKPSIHAQTLQATMKEVVEERGALPPELQPYLRQWDQIVVAVTKG